MEIDAFLKLVQNRRSTRKFKSNAVVASEDIQKILEAGRWAMSGANAQPWEFVVVDDAAIKERIITAWIEVRKESFVIENTRMPDLCPPHFRGPEVILGFKDAPVFIVVLGDRRTYQITVLSANYICGEGGANTDSNYLKNMGNATQNLHLAAAALGLGTQWVSVNRLWGEAIKQILGIPDILDVHTIVAVGHPAIPPKDGQRRPLEQIVHHNQYETEKFRSAEDIQKFMGNVRQLAKTEFDRWSK
ncbi:MAG: nitroreductase family protein [Dehalococcoidia bacterium]|nr:nitroreductase family protein [Dehalococcoidia bacterium]